MDKFYVYKVIEPSELAFIKERELKSFAQFEFTPLNMEFTGIVLKARGDATIDDLVSLYYKPSSETGQYLMSEEPSETANIKAGSSEFSYEIIRKSVQNLMLTVHYCIINLAKIFGKKHNNNPETIYTKLKQEAIEYLEKLDSGFSKKP